MIILALDLSMGALLTSVVSMTGVLYLWRHNRQLHQKEYADKIRRAAGLIIAKLDRWKALSMRFYEDIQPALTKADGMLIKERDATATRDYLWEELVQARARSSQRILEEKIEEAYADLYGYDMRIRELFVAVVACLQEIEDQSYELLLETMQRDVFAFEQTDNLASAALGNALRTSAGLIANECHRLMRQYVESFRAEAIKLIQATDRQLFAKSVKIESSTCLPTTEPVAAALSRAAESSARILESAGPPLSAHDAAVLRDMTASIQRLLTMENFPSPACRSTLRFPFEPPVVERNVMCVLLKSRESFANQALRNLEAIAAVRNATKATRVSEQPARQTINHGAIRHHSREIIAILTERVRTCLHLNTRARSQAKRRFLRARHS